MSEWRNGGRNGGNGGTAERMAEQQNGRNGYIRTIYGTHTHTNNDDTDDDNDDNDNNNDDDDDDDDDEEDKDDTLIFYSIELVAIPNYVISLELIKQR